MGSPIRTMMVHVDGTEQSIVAAQYAVLLAKQIEARLFAAFVVNTRALSDLVKTHIFLETEEQEYERDLEADADRYLNHVKQLAAQKDCPIETVKARGNVHQELIRMVTENHVDLLVLGELAHVRSRRDEFYNEAERAMRSVSCTVLIVKDEDRVYDLFESNL